MADPEAIAQAWARAAIALDEGNKDAAVTFGVRALEMDPAFRIHAPASGTSPHRVTGHELVPHTWALYVPHLEVVVVTRSVWDEFTYSAEIHRFADRITEFSEPTWVRYDPWVWAMHMEYTRGDPFATPLAWPE